jgi:hypothetical protein
MLNCIFEGATAVQLLAPIDAADTAAATSAYADGDVRGFEGQLAVIVQTGIADAGSITYTFLTATDASATGEAAVVPINGALTVVTTSNDPLTQVAVFDCTQLKGFLKVVGTVATGGVLVSYTAFGLKKYAS